MKYTMEQLRAAYALNLCTVSVSQIIDYADVNIMEQEYEAILNNLNLEQMPKDEALLNILKQILDTITAFRIQEEQRMIVEKEYQLKMKNAIWEAVPNLALIISGASPLTMSLSLLSQIGIGYMNYRRTKAQNEMDQFKENMKLDKDALERFNGLRRELFTTAWRLAEKYGFSDELRLSERQIRHYDMILMDNDPIRRFERLDMIKDEFIAYPPFWYYYGNTADAIANSELQIGRDTRERCRRTALEAFRQFRESNQYGLLREDSIASANALEMAVLLDPEKDRELIGSLTDEAVRFSGKEKDILQLAAVQYLNIGMREEASELLRQLVNEQYNTVINAQLLSGIYVHEYIKDRSGEMKDNYELLAMRAGRNNLYPLPEEEGADQKALEEQFVNEQKRTLVRKYRFVFEELANKYADEYSRIIPVPDSFEELQAESSTAVRKEQILRVFTDRQKADRYVSALRDAGIPFRVIDLINEIFASCCRISFISDDVQESLFADIQNAISQNREFFTDMQTKLNGGSFDAEDMKKLLDLELSAFTSQLYKDLAKELVKYIYTREELLDFSIAEMNLLEYCRAEGLPDPDTRIGKDGDAPSVSPGVKIRRIEYQMLGEEAMDISGQIANSSEMLALIREEIPKIIGPDSHTRFLLRDDVKLDRYFSKVYLLRKDPLLRSRTLAVLDGTGSSISDLIFTTHGVVMVRGQIVRKLVPYRDIDWSSVLKKELVIDGWYVNDDIDLDALYELIGKLNEKAEQLPDTSETGFGSLRL